MMSENGQEVLTDALSIGIALADALNRERALTPVESGWVAVLTGKRPS